jgi:hypothetical protein
MRYPPDPGGSGPLVTGGSVTASHRVRPLPIWSAGGSRDRARGCGITGDLGPCRPGPTPAEPPRGSATVKIAQGNGTPEGNRGEPDPGHGRRDRTGERRTKGNQRKAGEGKELGGQTGNRRKPAGGNRRTCGEAPDHPVRVRGFGAARIYDGHGHSPGRPARTAHSCTPAFWRPTAPVSRAPQMLRLPGSAGLRARRSSLLAYRVVRRGSRLACGSRRWPPGSGSPARPRGRRRT